MRIIIVEESDARKTSTFLSVAKQLNYVEVVNVFNQWNQAKEFLLHNSSIDIIVLDTEGENGLDIGNSIRTFFPNIGLLLIADATAYSDVLTAARINQAAYILRPYTAADLIYAMNASLLFYRKKKKRIFARTFGHFDLFVDGMAVTFVSAKARELLALLIDREGGVVTSDQAIGTLWEYRSNDNATQSLYSKVGKSLQEQLDKVNAGDLLINNRGSKNVDVSKLDCDLYQFLAGEKKAQNNFFGQYLIDYTWAEYRIAGLIRNMKP